MDFSEQRLKKTSTPFEALRKIKNWCAYQERSQHETRSKLRDLGLSSAEAEQIIASLIEENFLNEERFALALASGKFRIKHWGKIKIRLELKQHQVSDYLVKKALASIDSAAYEETLRQVVEKKLATLKQADRRKKFYTVINYALSRGFEAEPVTEYLNQLLEQHV